MGNKQEPQAPVKRKRVTVRSLSRGEKYAARHGYKSRSAVRRRNGRWVGKSHRS